MQMLGLIDAGFDELFTTSLYSLSQLLEYLSNSRLIHAGASVTGGAELSN
jgi:hypothetical protein